MMVTIPRNEHNLLMLDDFHKIIETAKFKEGVDFFRVICDSTDEEIHIVALVIESRHSPSYGYKCYKKLRAFVSLAGIEIHPEPDPDLHIPPCDRNAVGLHTEAHATHH